MIPSVSPVQVINHRPCEQLKKTISQLPTAIKSFIDNKSLLVELTIIHANKFLLALSGSVRHVNISKLSIRKFINHLSVVFYPFQVAKLKFLTLRERSHQNFFCIFHFTRTAYHQ